MNRNTIAIALAALLIGGLAVWILVGLTDVAGERTESGPAPVRAGAVERAVVEHDPSLADAYCRRYPQDRSRWSCQGMLMAGATTMPIERYFDATVADGTITVTRR